MAMPKLMLRSVLYGVDKIPDKWFEKVPGGFFKAKDENADGNSRRDSGSGGGQRSNNTNDGRRSGEDDNYDNERFRSDGRRPRHERSRSSYDGGADEDDYYISSDGRRRRKSGQSRRRRHSLEDNRRGHNDSPRRGQQRNSRDEHNEGRRSDDRTRRPTDPYYDRERPSTGGSNRSANAFTPGTYVAPDAALRTGGSPSSPQSPTARSPPIRSSGFSPTPPPVLSPGFPPPQQPRSGSIGVGYVPYAHLYGQQSPPPTRQSFSPRPSSSSRSSKPNGDREAFPPVAPPPQGYQQNPFAQQAPTAEAAGAGAAYTGEPGIRTTQDPRWANGPDPNYSARLYTGYGEKDAPRPDSASPRRSSRRDYSPSRDSYDSSAMNPRSRSERRSEPKWKNQAREEKNILEPQDVRMPTGSMSPARKGSKGDRRPSENQRDGTSERRDSTRGRNEGYYSD